MGDRNHQHDRRPPRLPDLRSIGREKRPHPRPKRRPPARTDHPHPRQFTVPLSRKRRPHHAGQPHHGTDQVYHQRRRQRDYGRQEVPDHALHRLLLQPAGWPTGQRGKLHRYARAGRPRRPAGLAPHHLGGKRRCLGQDPDLREPPPAVGDSPMSLNIPGSTGGQMKGDTLDTTMGRIQRPRPNDLTKEYPRSSRELLGGYAHLARMIDKARAREAGVNGPYFYPCPLDTTLLSFLAASEQIGRAHSELQSPYDLVCRLLLEKKKKK